MGKANIKFENQNVPQMFQENVRPAESFNFDELANVGEPFGGFVTETGDIWRFFSLNDYKSNPKLRRRQRVQTKLRPGEEPRWTYNILAERERNGVKSLEWFSLSFLAKTDADRKPVNKTWYDLGGADKRVEKLAEMGEISVLDTHKIRVTRFQGGQPLYVPTLDPVTKEQVVDQYGTGQTHVATREQDAHHITPVAENAAE